MQEQRSRSTTTFHHAPRSLSPGSIAPRSPLSTGTLLAALLTGLSACGSGGKAPELTPEMVRARDLAAEYMIQDRKEEARKALAPLVEREDAAAEDLLRAANIELSEEKLDAARPYVEKASKLAPDDPATLWARFRMARIEFENEQALAILEPLVRQYPDDFKIQLAYTLVLDDLDGPMTEAQAEERYRELMEVPDEVAESYIRVVLERMRMLLLSAGNRDEAMEIVARVQELAARDIKSPGEPAHQSGTLGEVLPHTRRDASIRTPEGHATSVRAREIDPEARGFTYGRTARGRTKLDVGERFGNREELFTHEPSPLRIAAFGPGGLTLYGQDATGSWNGKSLSDASITDALAFDRKDAGAQPSDTKASEDPGDQDLDLIVAVPGQGTLLFENVELARDAADLKTYPLFPQTSAEQGGLVPLDFDHDGDVDLALCTGGEARLYRNDGLDVDLKDDTGTPTGEIGPITDVTAQTTLPRAPKVMIAEDLDRDSDIDFVNLEEDAITFLSSLRAGRFTDATDELPAFAPDPAFIVAADFDGDSWVDIGHFGPEGLRIYTRTETGGWKSEELRYPIEHMPTGQPIVCDWDLDGTNDLLWPTATHPAAGILAPGYGAGGVAQVFGEAFDAPRGGRAQLAALDLDGDGDHDLLRAGEEGGLWEYLFDGHPRGALVELMGHKDSAHAIGAIVELRQGLLYRRLMWRGQSELMAVNGEMPELIRIRWPNGVVQNAFDAPLEPLLFWQRRGLQGSCPFLYTWNGQTYEFISDVIGITPLGLPMAPGQLVPPDHDEYVLVHGDKLVPRNGHYELQFTEELREVTYLDRIRLDVVDHPAEVEVFPEERFSFPPFPEPHTHTMRAPLTPTKATGSDRRDWTEELGKDDGRFARPFVTHGDQFRGLAEPYFLELEFDPARVKSAEKLRLAMNGWLVWTDASVNVASARHPEKAFVPPILQVPDGEGGWRDAGPPLGFPAGKLKTMVIDVGDRILREDPRIRIVSTLVLYWDSIRLAVDGDDAPLVVTPIEATSAELWERGFSQPVAFEVEGVPMADLEWFDWEQVAAAPRWNQHPGFYTRFGDVLPLLGEVDDRFVILGAGDALTVRFDAAKAPPLRKGWKRSFLVFFDGWAKDRDHNTEEALFVKPYPFHGMSGYPYGPDESFPDTEEHRRWEREWNTRPEKRWIEPLVPPLRRGTRPATSALHTGTAAHGEPGLLDAALPLEPGREDASSALAPPGE